VALGRVFSVDPGRRVVVPTRAERRDLERHDRFRLKRIQAPRDLAAFKNLEPCPAWRGAHSVELKVFSNSLTRPMISSKGGASPKNMGESTR
jgi:hypothetical protein